MSEAQTNELVEALIAADSPGTAAKRFDSPALLAYVSSDFRKPSGSLVNNAD